MIDMCILSFECEVNEMKKIYLIAIFLLGISMSILGFFILFNPDVSLTSVTLFIGLLLLLNGVNEIISYVKQSKVWNISLWHLIEGIFSLIIGLTAFFYTDVAQQVFVFIFAFWILLSGLSHIFISRTVKGMPGEKLIFVLGIVMLILAIISLFTQFIAAITVAIVIGVFFIAQGFIWISLGLVFRKLS